MPETSTLKATRARGWWLTLLLAVAGTLAPLAWYWGQGLTLVHRDSAGVYAPLRRVAGEALRAGHLPLWNPYCATGLPLLGETIHGLLHPVSLAAAFLFPGDGLDPLLGGYLVGGALGAWVLARAVGASLPAALLASFAYGLSGYPLSMTGNLVFLAGTAMAPWLLAGLRAVGSRPRPRSLLLAAAAVACTAFSGDIQLLAVGSAAGVALAAAAGGRRGMLTALAALLGGLLLAGVQLLPSWEFLQHSSRVLALADYDVRQWDLSPLRVLEFVSPGFFSWPADGWQEAPVFAALGDPTWFRIPFSESIFLGAGTLLLAGAGFAGRTGRALALVGAAAFWLALGRHLGARSLQDLLPVAKGFRYGEKYLPVLLACLATLAALGADRLVRDPKAARVTARVALLAGLIVAAAWSLLWCLPTLLSHPPELRLHLLHGLPHATGAALALAACATLACRGSRAALPGMVLTVLISTCAASSYALRPGHPEARLNAPPLQLVAAAPAPRVYNLGFPNRPPRAGWDSVDQLDFAVLTGLGANTNARHGIDNFSVDTGLFPLRWHRLTEALGPRTAIAARRYGVTHLVLPLPQDPAQREDLARMAVNGRQYLSDGRSGLEVWEIPHRPWASFVEQVVPVPDFEAALGAVVRATEVGSAETVVETPRTLPTSPGTVLSLTRRPERLELLAETGADATLVLNDAYWPGWHAFIDGREVPILPADALVRAVVWPAGRHTLVMEYSPPELAMGGWLSVAGMLLLAAGCFLLRFSTESVNQCPVTEAGLCAPPTVPGSDSGAHT